MSLPPASGAIQMSRRDLTQISSANLKALKFEVESEIGESL